jgi:branched-subunit amino acid ABC-type transport system permease component
MSSLLPYLVVGIASGSIYALAGMGLTLTFKTSGIVNFAHGAEAALAAFVLFELRQRVGLPWPLAALTALLVAGVGAGLILERLGVALASASTAARVAATVGLLVGIQGALLAVFGSADLQLRYFLPTRLIRFPGVNVRAEQLIIAAIALAAAGGLYVFFTRARLGVAMQAVVDDPVLTSLGGTHPTRVRRAAWIIGSCFAAVSGMLIAPTIGLAPSVLTELVLYAFGAAAIGAFTSLPLTYLGGLGIGVAASLITKYLHATGPLAALPSSLPIIVLFIALLVIPRARLAIPSTGSLRAALPPIRLPPRATAAGVAVGAAVLLAVPALVGAKIPDYTTALGFAVVFASLSLLVRTSGQVSLCHMAFAAVGATTFARALGAGFPWPIALLAGGLVAIPVGALAAIPAIRLPGPYLAIATMAFGLLIQQLVFGSFLMFGGAGTILRAARPVFGRSDTAYYYVVLAVATLCALLVIGVRRARLGRLLRGLADEPDALAALGTETNITRLLVFCISAFLAGIGGALIAPVTGAVTAPSFDFSVSLLLIAVLFVAGRQPILGAVIAAALYIVGPSYLTGSRAPADVAVAFGVAAVFAATLGGYPIVTRLAASKKTAERAARRPLRTRAVQA